MTLFTSRLAAVVGIGAAALLPVAWAQDVPSDQDLYLYGRVGLTEGNCVKASRFLYAYLLRNPADAPVGSPRRQRIADVINVCEASPQRYAGNMALFKTTIPTKEGLCEVYAEVAVAQNEVNRLAQCNLSGPRWSANPAYHARWCITAADLDIMGERQARQSALKQCGASAPDLK